MSSGLMSCVRENSPPLESGPFSLPAESSGSGSHTTNMAAVHSITHLASTGPGGGNGSGSRMDNTTAGSATPNAEQQKRRRFHPLRNLRRIFRRRTITTVTDSPSNTLPTPPSSSNSEKNLRSATLTSISSVVSASSPSSPLTHQQLQDAYSSQSLPKSKSYGISQIAGKSHRDALMLAVGHSMQSPLQLPLQLQLQPQRHQQQLQQLALKEYKDNGSSGSSKANNTYNGDMYTTASATATSSYQHHHSHHVQSAASTQYQRQSMGVAVLPSAMTRGFYTDRLKVRSIGDSSQDLESSGHDSSGIAATTMGGGRSGGEMTDSQRSLSEGRLVDSDYVRDQLSQSHDSVFSESATASSLSIVLKAELADVLRKRRNRPDASDEDLGLPRSPASPRRRTYGVDHVGALHPHSNSNNNATPTPTTTAGNHSEVSSLSLLSMNSYDGEDAVLAASTANNSMQTSNDAGPERHTSSSNNNTISSRHSHISTLSTLSTSSHSDVLRYPKGGNARDTKDEVDLFSSDWQRLSHAAAKHKMAVRPTKKKGPSRHRRTLETSIPEANEDHAKAREGSARNVDSVDHSARAKTRSLPPSVNTKLLDKQTEDILRPAAVTVAALDHASSNTSVGHPETPEESTGKTARMEKNSTKLLASSSSVTSIGSRTITTKSSSIFESSKESSSDPTPSELESKKKELVATTTTTTTATTIATVETAESGFLRRLITRNSKRSIAKAMGFAADDELESLQSEPKKLQISSSCFDTRGTNRVVDPPMLVEVSKSRSVTAFEQNIEEKRREIKREIKCEGKSGLSAMLNNFMIEEKNNTVTPLFQAALAKPKSGAAARQRCMPQDISSTLDKKPNQKELINPEPEQSAAVNLVGLNTKAEVKTSQLETFQSTSIIKEITASQHSAVVSAHNAIAAKGEVPALHFERKPKIVGLSAFQQKISRSNDGFARAANGSNSNSHSSLEFHSDLMDSSYELECKQRKLVEKSRSFRNYQAEHASDTTVHNNMPSLPDLSLNLRVPNCFVLSSNEKDYASPSPPESHDKSVSLGFEINDNNLMRPAMRASSAKQLSTTVMLNQKEPVFGSGQQLLAPTQVMPHLSPSNSCNQNISEIEQNIDLIVKSPYVSVLRKSVTCLEDLSDSATTKTTSASSSKNAKKSMEELPTSQSSPDRESVRPKVLHFLPQQQVPPQQEKTEISEERKQGTSTVTLSPSTPTTAAVLLREKKPSIVSPTSATTTKDADKVGEVAKEVERKSAPLLSGTPKNMATNSFKTARRSSSVVESAESSVGHSSVPEFLKVQLNRVDATMRVNNAKGNVVLAKYVKDTPSAPPPPSAVSKTNARSASTDDLLLRRLSNESVDIHEQSSPEMEKRVSGVFEAINKAAGKVFVSANANNNADLTPRSPSKKAAPAFGAPTATASQTGKEEPSLGVLRTKSSENVTTNGNSKISLQERKRLFMQEEHTKADRKVEELRQERKKSLSDELSRKPPGKAETRAEPKLEETELRAISAPVHHALPPLPATGDQEKENDKVILRKKSFQQHASASSSSSSSNNTISSNGSNKEDATPELMKVFARRSLKIKEEDLQSALENNSLSSSTSTSTGVISSAHLQAATLKRYSNTSTAVAANAVSSPLAQHQQQSVDSDKENQSASDEKLDKLSNNNINNNNKYEVIIEQLSGSSKLTPHPSVGHGHAIGNRNSVSDFRSSSGVAKSPGSSNNNGLTLSNNNNNTTNIATTTPTTTTVGSTAANKAHFLPTSRVANARNSSADRVSNGVKLLSSDIILLHNNNNNALTLSNAKSNNNNKHPLERLALNNKSLESTASTTHEEVAAEANSKAIERSATVSEFKGIHQRRAEWEQRAKEALK